MARLLWPAAARGAADGRGGRGANPNPTPTPTPTPNPNPNPNPDPNPDPNPKPNPNQVDVAWRRLRLRRGLADWQAVRRRQLREARQALEAEVQYRMGLMQNVS